MGGSAHFSTSGELDLPFMPDLNLTFLGTGTSQGVPMIGCECHVCTSQDPRDFRMRASVYVETPESAWVIDTGPDFRSQCLRHGVRRLDAVVYTHAHTDHIMGFDDLRPFCPFGSTLPIYASADTMDNLRRIFTFAFDGKNRFPGYLHPEPHDVAGAFRIGDTELTPLPVPHGRTTVFGYLLVRNGERLAAYLSDCKEVPPPVIEQIRGVRHLIVDALRQKPHPTHMNIEEALAVAAQVGAGQTWFTHLCHDLRHAELEPMLPKGVAVAYDGLKLSI
jgi:phosphoribosyl 1,2-cyclic phosphate phosphodiesterase